MKRQIIFQLESDIVFFFVFKILNSVCGLATVYHQTGTFQFFSQTCLFCIGRFIMSLYSDKIYEYVLHVMQLQSGDIVFLCFMINHPKLTGMQKIVPFFFWLLFIWCLAVAAR